MLHWLREIDNDWHTEQVKGLLNKFFPCKLNQEFWRVARIIWIGHYKNIDGPFVELPIEMICYILRKLFQDMGISHNNLAE